MPRKARFMRKLIGLFCLLAGPACAAPLTIAAGGTGAASAPAALVNLGAAAAGANADITSLSAMQRLNLDRGSITEPAASNAGTNYAAQFYASFAGTGGTGVYEAPVNITIPNDTLSYGGTNYVDGLEIQHNFGGVGQSAAKCEATPSLCGTGARAAEVVTLTQTGPSSNPSDTNYAAFVENETINYNDGGTAGFGNSRGEITGFNSLVQIGGTATYLSAVKTFEGDIGVAANLFPRQKEGLDIQENGGDASAGVYDDVGLSFNGSGLGFRNLITDGLSNGRSFTNASSTLFACGMNPAITSNKCLTANGFDLLTNWTWTAGGFPWKSPGVSIDASGNMAALSLKTNTISPAGGSITLTNAVLAGVPTAPTQAAGDKSTRVATDQFVASAVAAGAVSGTGGAGGANYPYIATNNAGYYVLGMVGDSSQLNASATPTVSKQFFWPIMVPNSLTWSQFGIAVMVPQAGQSCNVGVYADVVVSGADVPGGLLASTGGLSVASSASLVSAALTPASFSASPGVKYWASEICSGGSEALRALPASDYAPSLGEAPGTAGIWLYLTAAGTGTTLPPNAAGPFTLGNATSSGPGIVYGLQ